MAMSENVVMSMSRFLFGITATASLLICAAPAMGQAAPETQVAPATQAPARPTPPTRDPHTPGYVAAKELPDDEVPPANADGNFIIGPTHSPAPGMATPDTLPNGTVFEFTMESADS